MNQALSAVAVPLISGSLLAPVWTLPTVCAHLLLNHQGRPLWGQAQLFF